MGTNVYANNFEISSKGASGMTAGAMPDPCFTPPPTPAGVEPVIPYPNTAKASDLKKGSTKVKICNKEAALEDASYMSTSMGDEAAKASTMQGGVMTKTTKGKAFYVKWSSDVKFEGKGVCRHVDPTTHNHGSTPGHCVPTPYMDGMNTAASCADELDAIKGESGCGSEQGGDGESKGITAPKGICKNFEILPRTGNASAIYQNLSEVSKDNKYQYINAKSDGPSIKSQVTAAMADAVQKDKCLSKLRCVLQKYKDTDNSTKKEKDTSITCCKGQSGHHVIPHAMAGGLPECLPGHREAPVVCVEGTTNRHGTHGMIHRNLARLLEGKTSMDCEAALKASAQSMHDTFTDCSEGCIEAQLKEANEKKCTKSCKSRTSIPVHSGYSGPYVKGSEVA